APRRSDRLRPARLSRDAPRARARRRAAVERIVRRAARLLHRRSGACDRPPAHDRAEDGMSYAVLSCDLDTIDRHLQGYGFADVPPCDRVYRPAVPRVLELAAELGVPCVLFTIARDAEREAALPRAAVAAGHEIASHSLTHPQPFGTLDDARL